MSWANANDNPFEAAAPAPAPAASNTNTNSDGPSWLQPAQPPSAAPAAPAAPAQGTGPQPSSVAMQTSNLNSTPPKVVVVSIFANEEGWHC